MFVDANPISAPTPAASSSPGHPPSAGLTFGAALAASMSSAAAPSAILSSIMIGTDGPEVIPEVTPEVAPEFPAKFSGDGQKPKASQPSNPEATIAVNANLGPKRAAVRWSNFSAIAFSAIANLPKLNSKSAGRPGIKPGTKAEINPTGATRTAFTVPALVLKASTPAPLTKPLATAWLATLLPRPDPVFAARSAPSLATDLAPDFFPNFAPNFAPNFGEPSPNPEPPAPALAAKSAIAIAPSSPASPRAISIPSEIVRPSTPPFHGAPANPSLQNPSLPFQNPTLPNQPGSVPTSSLTVAIPAATFPTSNLSVGFAAAPTENPDRLSEPPNPPAAIDASLQSPGLPSSPEVSSAAPGAAPGSELTALDRLVPTPPIAAQTPAGPSISISHLPASTSGLTESSLTEPSLTEPKMGDLLAQKVQPSPTNARSVAARLDDIQCQDIQCHDIQSHGPIAASEITIALDQSTVVDAPAAAAAPSSVHNKFSAQSTNSSNFSTPSSAGSLPRAPSTMLDDVLPPVPAAASRTPTATPVPATIAQPTPTPQPAVSGNDLANLTAPPDAQAVATRPSNDENVSSVAGNSASVASLPITSAVVTSALISLRPSEPLAASPIPIEPAVPSRSARPAAPARASSLDTASAVSNNAGAPERGSALARDIANDVLDSLTNNNTTSPTANSALIANASTASLATIAPSATDVSRGTTHGIVQPILATPPETAVTNGSLLTELQPPVTPSSATTSPATTSTVTTATVTPVPTAIAAKSRPVNAPSAPNGSSHDPSVAAITERDIAPTLTPATPPPSTPPATPPAQVGSEVAAELPKSHQMLDSAPSAPPAAPPPPIVPGSPADVQMNSQVNGQMHVGVRTDAFGAVEIHTVVQQSQIGITVHSDRDLSRWFSSEVPSLESGLNQHHLNLTAVDFDSGRSGVQTATSFQHGGQPRQPSYQSPGSQSAAPSGADSAEHGPVFDTTATAILTSNPFAGPGAGPGEIRVSIHA